MRGKYGSCVQDEMFAVKRFSVRGLKKAGLSQEDICSEVLVFKSLNHPNIGRYRCMYVGVCICMCMCVLFLRA